MRWTLAAAFLIIGCSEYEWTSQPPALDGGDSELGPQPGEGGDGSGGGSGSSGGGAGNGDDGGFGDGGGGGGQIPDEFVDDDCSDGVLATWISGEIYVLASSAAPAVGQLDVPVAGIYHLYDIALAESGDRQLNESAYIRVPTSANQDGAPMFGNCSGEYVVPDSDNTAPPPPNTTQYLGTFWLDQGVNTVEMYHYCWLVDDGGCTDFLDPTPGHECSNGGNPNSVHMTGGGICLRPAN